MQKMFLLYVLVVATLKLLSLGEVVALATDSDSSTYVYLTVYTTPASTTAFSPTTNNSDQRIISRGKSAYQSATYRSRVANNAVNGEYDLSSPERCSTAFFPSYTSGPPLVSIYNVWWYVDLGDMFAVFSVTMYSAQTLPDIIFFRDLYVVVSSNNQSTGQQCGNTYGQDTTQSGVATVNCSTFVYGRLVLIHRATNNNSNLTLCEVDVYGSKLIFSPLDKLSLGKPANQPATYTGRTASLANDGFFDTTVADNCATSIAYHPYNRPMNIYNYNSVFAWWQVDLQQLCMIASVQLNLPQNFPDSSYIQQTQIPFVYVNNVNNLTLGTSYQCSLSQVTSENIYNYTCSTNPLYPPYVFGRYVTIKQNTYQYLAVMTLCEVTVYGYKVQLAVNDPSFSLEPTLKTPDSGTKEDYATYKSLAIAAIVIACVTFVLLVVVSALLIKQMLMLTDLQAGKPSNAGRRQSRSNEYNNRVAAVDTTSDRPDELYDDVKSPRTDDLDYELPPVPPPTGRKKR